MLNALDREQEKLAQQFHDIQREEQEQRNAVDVATQRIHLAKISLLSVCDDLDALDAVPPS